MASSRLGHDHDLHRKVCRFVGLSLMECRRRHAILVVAVGSAIEPWATRAAELYHVDVLHVLVNDEFHRRECPLSLRVSIPSGDLTLSRDETVIAMADRVDVVYARQAGTVSRCVEKRVADMHDGSTRVALTGLPKCAGKNLVAKGAVGWITKVDPIHCKDTTASSIPATRSDWIYQNGQWLVHCTRACQGPWPGETENQYRDALLLGNDGTYRQPIDTLRRIVRSEKLIASAITTAKSWPVVCFSEAPLADLLLARCYRPHLKRWDYEPYGVAIRKEIAVTLGFQPVIYGQPVERKSIRKSDQYRFQAIGKTYDWTAEQEWRINQDVDLSHLAIDDVRIFVATQQESEEIAAISRWQTHVVLQAAPMDTEPV